MTQDKPDSIDLRILNILQQEGRMEVNRLAKLVHLTPGPVHTRIEKLLAQGYIRRFGAVLDRVRIGRPVLVVLMVRLKAQNTPLLEAFEELVKDMPPVQSCFIVSGSWNFILQVTAATPQDYAVWLLEKITSHPNVGEVESNFLLKESKNNALFEL
ncbi:Lrp/AsnC family transcriptional regulator [Mucilaginibacter sp. AW1-3]